MFSHQNLQKDQRSTIAPKMKTDLFAVFVGVIVLASLIAQYVLIMWLKQP
jgi:hypothetical protein